MADAARYEILNDTAANEDLLDFETYRDVLVEAIVTSPPPFTLGIFGEWGCGKTTLMEFVEDKINAEHDADGMRTVWFNAWKYDGETAIWNAMLKAVFDQMADKGLKEGDEAKRANFDKRVKALTKNGTRLAVKVGTRIATGGKIKDGDLDKFFEMLTNSEPDWNALDARAKLEAEFKSLVSEFVGTNGRLIMFVDDLDRCMPEQAIAVLEAMKFFFDHDNCMFVIGADRVVLEAYLDQKYERIEQKSGRDYLEKLIQLPFNMSAIDPAPALDILDKYGGTFDRSIASLDTLILAGTRGNPRRIKRFANIYSLLIKLRPLETDDDPLTVAYAIMMQMRFPTYFEAFARNGDLLLEFVAIMDKHANDRPDELRKHQVYVDMYADTEFMNFFEETQPEIKFEKIERWLRFTRELVA